MSVSIIPSPASRCKRLYEEEVSYEGGQLDARQKRLRLHRGSPVHARCGSTQQAVNAIAALQALFPGMDEKVIQDVLYECGNSIDAAIKRLTDLKLSTEDATVAAATAAASADEGQTGTPGTRTPPVQEAPQGPVPTSSPGEPQTGEQWCDYLVSQMLPAKDMGDARTRAAHVLQNFERFIKQRQKEETDVRLAELAKETAIFKRAVQIQDARIKSGQEEVTQLRTMLAHYQERCSKLETNNYSLAMHLQQATNASGFGSHHHNPDVC